MRLVNNYVVNHDFLNNSLALIMVATVVLISSEIIMLICLCASINKALTVLKQQAVIKSVSVN